MEMWFSDDIPTMPDWSLRVERQLFSAESEYQRIGCPGIDKSLARCLWWTGI